MKFVIAARHLIVLLLYQVNANQLCIQRPTSSKAPLPIRVFATDFDNTVTTLASKDFMAFTYEAKLQFKNSDRGTQKAVAKRWKDTLKLQRQTEQTIIKVTLQKLERLSKGITARKLFLLREALAKMDSKARSFQKEQKDFLKGITLNGIREVASKFQICSGVIETLNRLHNNPANIISAGPSKTFVETILQKYKAPKNLVLHVGEFVFNNGLSTGEIANALSSADKERVMGELIERYKNVKGYSLYVGNTFVDILAMLTADIGIAINYTPLFVGFLGAVGIATAPLSEWNGACTNREYLIYTAESWYEIEELMFG